MPAIPKTPPGLSKSQRRKWREEQREKRERGRERDTKEKILNQIRENRRQNREPSPPPVARAVPPRFPSPFEAARPESPRMSQSRRLFSPASTRSSLGYAGRARNGYDSGSSDDEFGGMAAATAARARMATEVGLLACSHPIASL